MMKKLLLLSSLSLLFFTTITYAQAPSQLPEQQLTKAELEAHMQFLASDELQGRRTGAPGNNIAARYIASYFEAYGLKQAPGAVGYYQQVPFESVTPPQSGKLTIDNTTYELGKDLVIVAGDAVDVKTTAVFANYGWVDETKGTDDYKGLDVKGKVVFVLPGTPDDQSRQAMFRSGSKKRAWAAEHGAVALIELYRMQFPWNFFVNYFGKEGIRLADDDTGDMKSTIAYGFFKEPTPNPITDLQKGQKLKVEFQSGGTITKSLASQNVIGVIEGTDPVLKNEYIMLTAHYDHIGVGKQGGGTYTAEDSIFNGARDNAFGVIGVLAAAKVFSQHPPKRSVIFMCVTGEEIGLLGSKYYADHPLIPLKDVIFNLNTDGAGYNDTNLVTIIGLGRTGTDEDIKAGAKPYGLEVGADPAPEQGLFDRSDNVSFALKGVPAVDFSPGFTAFDQTIMKYYHQVTDNPDTIDYDYLLRFCQAYVHTARIIGDRAQAPVWVSGDKYESAGKALYNK